MNRVMILLALACTAASALAADKQQVYKWTDANGVVHFSDAPPPKDTQNVQSMRLVGGTTATASSTEDEGKAAAADASKTVASAPPPPAAEDARAKECEQAQRNLKVLQSDLPVSELGADGKVKPIEDKERAARIAGVQDRIAQYCTK